MLAGAVQARSIWDGPLAVAASPVGAPGVVGGGGGGGRSPEISVTLMEVPSVSESPPKTSSKPGSPDQRKRHAEVLFWPCERKASPMSREVLPILSSSAISTQDVPSSGVRMPAK